MGKLRGGNYRLGKAAKQLMSKLTSLCYQACSDACHEARICAIFTCGIKWDVALRLGAEATSRRDRWSGGMTSRLGRTEFSGRAFLSERRSGRICAFLICKALFRPRIVPISAMATQRCPLGPSASSSFSKYRDMCCLYCLSYGYYLIFVNSKWSPNINT